jgi:hypothetical protein
MPTRIALLAFLLLAPASALAQGARLQLDSLDRLADQASEVVNVSVDQGLLKMALAFIKGGTNEAAVKQMLSQLRGIYVKSFEFDRDINLTTELDQVRKQLLSNSNWVRLINVDSKREHEQVEIYSWREGDSSGGLAILAAEPMEITVVNIVGTIDITKLALLEGQLGIPRINIDVK